MWTSSSSPSSFGGGFLLCDGAGRGSRMEPEE